MNQEHYQNIDDISVCFYKEGEGTPLIFIHGLGGTLNHWTDSYKFFSSQGFQVIGLDLPGYGKSDKPKIEYTIAFYADFLKKFIENFKLKEKPILIGNSMGGHIASYFAIHYPEDLQGLLILDGSGLNELNLLEELTVQLTFRQQHIGRILRYMIDIFAVNVFYRSTSKGALKFIKEQKEMATREDHPAYCHALEKSTKAMMLSPLKDLLSNIQVPTQIVWGSHDRLIPSFYAQKFKDLISHSDLTIIKQCGHVPQLEKPDEFNEILLTFLKNRLPHLFEPKKNLFQKFFSFFKKTPQTPEVTV